MICLVQNEVNTWCVHTDILNRIFLEQYAESLHNCEERKETRVFQTFPQLSNNYRLKNKRGNVVSRVSSCYVTGNKYLSYVPFWKSCWKLYENRINLSDEARRKSVFKFIAPEATLCKLQEMIVEGKTKRTFKHFVCLFYHTSAAVSRRACYKVAKFIIE